MRGPGLHVRTVDMTTPGRSGLISVSELAHRLQTPTPPVLLDVRWTVGAGALPNDYLAGHIPGAWFCDLDADLADAPGAGGRHPLPNPERLQGRLREWGMDDDSSVVAYDGDSSVAAARAWWVLRWIGLENITVLDGGYAAWSNADQPVETGARPGRRDGRSGSVTVRPGSLPTLDPAGAAKLAEEGLLVDVRTPERFRGEAEPIDPVAGHIPGAINVPLAQAMSTDLTFAPPATLSRALAAAGLPIDGIPTAGQRTNGDANPLGVYCGSGVTAAHMVLAMHEAGIEAALYPGSWSHWITDVTRPVATVESESAG